MPVVMYKAYSLPRQFSEEEQTALKDLIDNFRLCIGDDIPEDNVLYMKIYRYSDNRVVSFLSAALRDINGFGVPKTQYSLLDMYREDANLLVNGAIIMALRREGIFQTANQIDFNDAGLSIAMNNKSGAYQSWWGILMTEYVEAKKIFKSGIIPKSMNSGFIGISSEFGYRFGGY